MLSAAKTSRAAVPAPDLAPGPVLTKAMLRAADIVGLKARLLAQVIGVSEATLSRMKSGDVMLEPGTKPFELAVLVVRLFRSLDAISGGDDAVARSWMGASNLALNGTPAEMIITVTGLVDVVTYLDAHRAVL